MRTAAGTSTSRAATGRIVGSPTHGPRPGAAPRAWRARPWPSTGTALTGWCTGTPRRRPTVSRLSVPSTRYAAGRRRTSTSSPGGGAGTSPRRGTARGRARIRNSPCRHSPCWKNPCRSSPRRSPGRNPSPRRTTWSPNRLIPGTTPPWIMSRRTGRSTRPPRAWNGTVPLRTFPTCAHRRCGARREAHTSPARIPGRDPFPTCPDSGYPVRCPRTPAGGVRASEDRRPETRDR